MRRGLTTVEVLVASAIVIVFLAIGLPAARALTGRARGSACAERLHTLGNALTMYANDNEGALPPATTTEWAWISVKGVSKDELIASPSLLRSLLGPYAVAGAAWFCPLDPESGRNVLWLGQRHFITSFAYESAPSKEEPLWPPHPKLGESEGILLSDACGTPSRDSAARFHGRKGAESNHADGSVNAIRHDGSLWRRRAADCVR